MINPRKRQDTMPSRYTKVLIALAATGAIAVPAVAQARQGSDDPVGHQRHEHHQVLRGDHRRGSDDGINHDRRGADDGANHR
jgi:hypothetical protein